ncbi:MSHA biogenesis protein MshK [Vibrio ponticus]|uniref:MSHA biogenesis protein MshK n=1 Tax=Vibrio ponticus TaxID=265668 RepID=A0ABX3FB37_9VIBR|nr:MSHA biogenesis protein MshK [Vibrio ponticus]OLQ88891.1 MSHA biogenesis protein MshK [Vibrio ponticus]
MANKSLLFLLLISPLTLASQDPTAPLDWQAPVKTAQVKKVVSYRVPNLQSIVCGEREECYAILDGKTKARGEKISGFSVKQINPDFVTVTRGNKQWKLEPFPLEVKQ